MKIITAKPITVPSAPDEHRAPEAAGFLEHRLHGLHGPALDLLERDTARFPAPRRSPAPITRMSAKSANCAGLCSAM
jgi:hypothetical protein